MAWGTGFILILVALNIHTTHLGVGDLAIFILYLGNISAFTSCFGSTLAKYAQTGVSFERMATLLQGPAPQTLVAPQLLYLKGALPEIQAPKKTRDARLEVVEAHGLTYRYPDTGRGIEGRQSTYPTWHINCNYRACCVGEDNIAARLAGIVAARCGRDIVGMANDCCRSSIRFLCLHTVLILPQVPQLV